jgi:phosphoenolpyruvate carboxykinase (diphosphate)
MQNAIKYGAFYIQDLEEDSKMADMLINYDYSPLEKHQARCPSIKAIFSPHRTLGSAVKLLTPSDQYSDEYNNFLLSLPVHVKQLALYIKRMYRSHLDTGSWKEYLNVDLVNGRNGNALALQTQ